MADLFFYGTLRHVPLLETVLGRSRGALQLLPAVLADHSVHWVRDQPFPMILRDPGGQARGLLARGLDADDIDRLNYYEGGFDYGLSEAEVQLETGGTAPARVFFPAPGLWRQGDIWSLEDWVDRWGRLSVRAAEEVMGYRGHREAREVAAIFPGIRRRAAAWVDAQDRPADPDRDPDRDIAVIARRRPYAEFFSIEETDLQFRRHDGAMSHTVNRAALMVGQAAVVLPYDPVADTVLLIEQFRAPVFMAGDRAPWVWEPVAGLVDPGETPEQTAHREAMEEAGLTLSRLEPAAQVYCSTGNSGEFLHLFIGLTNLSNVRAGDGGGLESEGENIRSRVFSFAELMQGVDGQIFRDMPLVTTALWLARHRERLRATP